MKVLKLNEKISKNKQSLQTINEDEPSYFIKNILTKQISMIDYHFLNKSLNQTDGFKENIEKMLEENKNKE